MGLRYRKSFGSKIGRVTVSKSGVGFSVGTKGYRVAKKAGGGYRTTSSIPGTGVSYSKDHGKTRSKNKSVSSAAIDWKIIVACFFFFTAIRCGLSDDGVPQLTAFLAVCGVLMCVWSGISGQKKNKSSHKEDVAARLAVLSDEEFMDYKESMMNYIQTNRESAVQSSDMRDLMQAIREEDERRNG